MTLECDHPEARYLPAFCVLEMMMVLTLILIAARLTQPIYQNIILRAREAALRDTLYTMRSLIDRFTLDNKRPPPAVAGDRATGTSAMPTC